MSDNDFPEIKHKPHTLKQIIECNAPDLWYSEPNDEGRVKQASDYVLEEIVTNLSHPDSEDSGDFVFNVLNIGGDFTDFTAILKDEISKNPQSELAKYWEKTSKNYAQYLIERAEDTDFMVSTAYKEAQDEWRANEFEIIEIENYLNRKGE